MCLYNVLMLICMRIYVYMQFLYIIQFYFIKEIFFLTINKISIYTYYRI